MKLLSNNEWKMKKQAEAKKLVLSSLVGAEVGHLNPIAMQSYMQDNGYDLIMVNLAKKGRTTGWKSGDQILAEEDGVLTDVTSKILTNKVASTSKVFNFKQWLESRAGAIDRITSPDLLRKREDELRSKLRKLRSSSEDVDGEELDKTKKELLSVIDQLKTAASQTHLQKRALYEGVQGYFVSQRRAWSNCVKCKQDAGTNPQKAWDECLEEYQKGSKDAKWVLDYASDAKDKMKVKAQAYQSQMGAYWEKIDQKKKAGMSTAEAVDFVLKELERVGSSIPIVP